jgi:uncharacterized membrane protein
VKLALGILSALLALAYPVAVYVGLSRFSVRGVGLLLIALLLPNAISKFWRRRAQAKDLIGLTATALFLVLLAMAFDDERFMRAYPVAINAALLFQFAWTLRRPPSMVERFARMQVDDLTDGELAYCRGVTRFWIGFFAVNGALSGAFALFASRETWALYTGLIAYVAMGLCFAVEFVLRKYRFRHHAPQNALDRLFARVFPNPSPSSES